MFCQKCAVKTPAFILKKAMTTKAKIGTNLVTVTIVLMAAADSIPCVTSNVSAHDTIEATIMALTLFPDLSGGKK